MQRKIKHRLINNSTTIIDTSFESICSFFIANLNILSASSNILTERHIKQMAIKKKNSGKISNNRDNMM